MMSRPGGQRHDAVLDSDLKALRVHQGALRDHVVGHFAADLLVWPAEDAEHIGLADHPG
jgi:hypothetical protein